MVNKFHNTARSRRQSGMLITEIIIALAIIVMALMPLSASFLADQKMTQRLYQKAVAMEIIDGEMEVLLSGEWHAFKEGAQPYPISAAAAKSLPPGNTKLTITGNHLRLEWSPENGNKALAVAREATAK